MKPLIYLILLSSLAQPIQAKESTGVETIQNLFTQISKCKFESEDISSIQCKLNGLRLEPVDLNSNEAKPLIDKRKDFFDLVYGTKDADGNKVFPDNAGIDMKSREDHVFPHWSHIDGDLYLYYGLKENGEGHATASAFKVVEGEDSSITIHDPSTIEILLERSLIMSVVEEELLRLRKTEKNPGLKITGSVDMTEGGVVTYELSAQPGSICAIHEPEELGDSGKEFVYIMECY